MPLSLHERKPRNNGKKSDNTGRESNTVMPLQTALKSKYDDLNFLATLNFCSVFKASSDLNMYKFFFENGKELMGVMRKKYSFNTKCENGVLKMESKF